MRRLLDSDADLAGARDILACGVSLEPPPGAKSCIWALLAARVDTEAAPERPEDAAHQMSVAEAESSSDGKPVASKPRP